MARPVIDVKNVYRIYETKAGFTPALRGVSLTVERGEFLAIMGPSGSGKSTLMNILGCLDRPTTGSYCLEGLEVAELKEDDLAVIRAERLGFVFQSFNLLPRATVLRNVMLPLVYSDLPVKERELRAWKALRAVNLPEENYFHRSNELSGGQMQRVAIARALVNDPALILADEPTGNLDTATGEMVMRTFQRMQRRGKTIVLITHDAEVAAWADRTVHIRDGKLLTDEEEKAFQARLAAGEVPASKPAFFSVEDLKRAAAGKKDGGSDDASGGAAGGSGADAASVSDDGVPVIKKKTLRDRLKGVPCI